MIKNQRQYRITKAQAEKLQQALTQVSRRRATSKVHPLLQKAQADALRGQLADLQDEVKQFETLQSGKRATLSMNSLDDLPRTLIQARIVAGLSQKSLADRLGLKEQQIQRYEATNYASTSLTRIQQVAEALGLHVHAEATVA